MIHQRGFSLIEALIALVILSMGLMGVAAMQLKALQSATAGYQRSVATLAAVDAQERIWEAMVQQGKNCQLIDMAKVTTVEGAWQGEWFSGSDTPLRNYSGSLIEVNGTCAFSVTINMGEGPGGIEATNFVYTFKLPVL